MDTREPILLPDIRSMKQLDGMRQRSGMYIAKSQDVYDQLILNTLWHAVDEFKKGNCITLTICVAEKTVEVSYNAGMSLESSKVEVSLAQIVTTQLCVCRITTWHSEDVSRFCNMGIAVVNAFSTEFFLKTVWNGQQGQVLFQQGHQIGDFEITSSDQSNQTYFQFTPDPTVLGQYNFSLKSIETMAVQIMNEFVGLQISVLSSQ
jgi:DNA gyrase/topoisomerase IV subunit B